MSDFNPNPQMDNGDRPPPIGIASVGRGARVLGRQALAVIGLMLVILSIPIGFLTPFIPIGFPMGFFGTALLARNSVWGQQLIRYILRRYPKLEAITPNWLLKLIMGPNKTG